MGDTLLIIIVFGGMTVSIWLSYKFFMRGSTDAEKVSALLPAGFKPDWEYRYGDTYAGYESSSDRLALVDWPHAKVVSPREVRAVEKVDESSGGIKHRWVVLKVDDPKVPRYRLWFRFDSGRDRFPFRLRPLPRRRQHWLLPGLLVQIIKTRNPLTDAVSRPEEQFCSPVHERCKLLRVILGPTTDISLELLGEPR